MPLPARRIETRHSFLPASSGKAPLSSGVSIAVGSRGNSRVASYANSRLISRSSRRNSAVEVLRSRISDNLCWTSGCATTVRPARCCSMMIISSLEHGPIADDREGRITVRTALARDFPAGSPAAAFEDAGERELFGGYAEVFAYPDSEPV